MAGTTTALLASRYKRAQNPAHSAHTPLVVPLSYMVALYTDVTGLAAGSPTSEVSTANTGYARQTVTFNDAFVNSASITFPSPVGNNWGTVRYFGLLAEVSTGVFELWWYGRLSDLQGADVNLDVIAGGPPLWIQAGNLDVSTT